MDESGDLHQAKGKHDTKRRQVALETEHKEVVTSRAISQLKPAERYVWKPLALKSYHLGTVVRAVIRRRCCYNEYEAGRCYQLVCYRNCQRR